MSDPQDMSFELEGDNRSETTKEKRVDPRDKHPQDESPDQQLSQESNPVSSDSEGDSKDGGGATTSGPSRRNIEETVDRGSVADYEDMLTELLIHYDPSGPWKNLALAAYAPVEGETFHYAKKRAVHKEWLLDLKKKHNSHRGRGRVPTDRDSPSAGGQENMGECIAFDFPVILLEYMQLILNGSGTTDTDPSTASGEFQFVVPRIRKPTG